MDTALPQKFPFILDRKLAKTNCTENQVCPSFDTVVLVSHKKCYTLLIVSEEIHLFRPDVNPEVKNKRWALTSV